MKKERTATPAIAALTKAGIVFRLREYHHDPATTDYGAEAADALDVDPRMIFKTLMVDTGSLAVAVVPVGDHLDLKALAAAVGAKRARMADPHAATRSSGYVLGGISPIGQRTRLDTVIDTSVRSWPAVLVSAGRRGLQVELAPADLIAITDARLAAIAS